MIRLSKIGRYLYSFVNQVLILSGVVTLINVCKGDGLPGEFVISDQWKAFFKTSSPVSNPALMMENSYTTVRGIASISPDDISRLWEAGVVIPLGYYHSVGFCTVGENGRDVVDVGETYLDGREQISVSQNNNYNFSASYAVNPLGKLSLGTNLNGFYQGNFGEPRFGFGADLGMTYRLFYHPVFGYHLAGLTFQNLVTPRLDLTRSMGYAAHIKVLYHASVLQNRFGLDLQYDLKDFLTDPQAFLFGKKPEWEIFVLGNVKLFPVLIVKGFISLGDSKKLDCWGTGFEFNVPQLNGGRDFAFLYQYRDEVRNSLSGSHSLYFKADFGRNREEIAASRIARVVNMTANELYNRAMKLYYKNNFWDAYFLFTRLLVEYPDFYKNDYVTYYAGSCMENIDMREDAIKLFQTVRSQYSGSPVVPMTDLALMRVFYRQGDFQNVKNQFVELNRPSISDSLRFHGAYLMGEVYLKQQDPNSALPYFELLPESHPDFIFAQISYASAHAQSGADMQVIASDLESCISTSAKTDTQKEAVNRALVHLGYLYYEENALSKAVTAFRMVPAESFYYEDALLGLGWTAIKARQWNDCINAGLLLAQQSGKFIMQCEGALLQAYGLMLEKQYSHAQLLLEPIVKRIHEYPGLFEDSLSTSRMKYESDRLSYAFLGQRTSEMARRGVVAKSQSVDSLHAEQIRQKGVIDTYLRFEDDFRRTSFFERNISTLKEDLEYALAKIQKIMNSESYLKNKDKIISKDKAISDEIEKLKQEFDNAQ